MMIEARPCQLIHSFAAELVALAWQSNSTVYGRFNQHVLEAKPGMSREQVVKPWDDAQRQSYFGERK